MQIRHGKSFLCITILTEKSFIHFKSCSAFMKILLSVSLSKQHLPFSFLHWEVLHSHLLLKMKTTKAHQLSGQHDCFLLHWEAADNLMFTQSMQFNLREINHPSIMSSVACGFKQRNKKSFPSLA